MPGGLDPPLSVIESWPSANLVNPTTRTGVVPLCAVLGVLSVLVVCARLWARAAVLRNVGLDDWIMAAAMIPTIGLTVGVCLATTVYGFDRHIWDLPVAAFVPARKITFANEFLYILSSGLIKISILCFYRRLAAGTLTSTFVRLVRCCIIFVLAYMLTFTLTLFFACQPFSAFWEKVNPIWTADHTYKCTDQGADILASSCISVLQDLIATLLPMALFWHLAMPWRQKAALGVVFGLGFFTCAVGALRIWYTYQVFYATYDVTWVSYDLWLWTSVEVLMATILASIPALKVYTRTLLHHRPTDRTPIPTATPSTSTLSRLLHRKLSIPATSTTSTNTTTASTSTNTTISALEKGEAFGPPPPPRPAASRQSSWMYDAKAGWVERKTEVWRGGGGVKAGRASMGEVRVQRDVEVSFEIVRERGAG